MMKRCTDEGVPAEAFDHVTDLREVVSDGAGSPGARMQILSNLLGSPIYMNAPDEKKINLERDYTAASVNGTKVDRYARSVTDKNIPTSDDSIITLENQSLSQGGEATVASEQNHPNHAASHLQKGQEITQGVYQGGQDPQQALAGLQAVGKHTSDHLAMMKGNPTMKQQLDQLNQQLQALGGVADKLQEQVTEQQQAAQQQNPQDQVSDNLKIGMAKVAADTKVKGAKVAADIQLKRAKTAADVQTQFLKTRFDHRVKDAQAAHGMRLKSKQAAQQNLQKTAA